VPRVTNAGRARHSELLRVSIAGGGCLAEMLKVINADGGGLAELLKVTIAGGARLSELLRIIIADVLHGLPALDAGSMQTHVFIKVAWIPAQGREDRIVTL